MLSFIVDTLCDKRGAFVKQLIINADDFGLHETVNLGIIQGHRTGFITSTTIMANGNAFEHAVELGSQNKDLGIGVHLTLVSEKPVCAPEQVKSLVDMDGYLPSQYPQFLLSYLKGQVALTDIARELRAQVQKVVATGISVTHLDSHQHMHIVPGIIEITMEIAKEFGIKAIRIPREPYFFQGGYPCPPMRFIARGGLTFLSHLAARKVRQSQLATSQHFFGMLAGCNMREEYLLNIIDALPDGISEIMMHPGSNNDIVNTIYNWDLHGQEELAAVTSDNVRCRLAAQKVNLISFRDL